MSTEVLTVHTQLHKYRSTSCRLAQLGMYDSFSSSMGIQPVFMLLACVKHMLLGKYCYVYQVTCTANSCAVHTAVYKETPWQLFILKDCTTHSSPIATMWVLVSTQGQSQLF